MTDIAYGLRPTGTGALYVVEAPNTRPRKVGYIRPRLDGTYTAAAFHPEAVEAEPATRHPTIDDAANWIADTVETIRPPRPRITTAAQWRQLTQAATYETV